MQSGSEKTTTFLLPALAGANMLYGMGMLELGVTFSYAQLMVDDEIAGLVRRTIRGVDVNEKTLATDLILEKGGGLGKHYMMDDHTIEFLKTEQQLVKLFDRKTRGTWLTNGGGDCTARAEEKARDLFHSHKPDPLPPAVLKELQRIIADAEK